MYFFKNLCQFMKIIFHSSVGNIKFNVTQSKPITNLIVYIKALQTEVIWKSYFSYFSEISL